MDGVAAQHALHENVQATSDCAHKQLHVLTCHSRGACQWRHQPCCHQRCIGSRGSRRRCAAGWVGDDLQWVGGRAGSVVSGRHAESVCDGNNGM